jgi:hypothetical protein
MRLNRAGEIDYYEELGVDRGASPEEIRDSFRSLVRLLHPDHQRDENLKAIAERQLRKVNRIYAVLSDPDRRRRYDASLEGELRRPTIVFSPVAAIKAKELITRFVWIGAAVLGVAVVIWIATDSPPAPVLTATDRVSAAGKTSVAVTSAPASESPAVSSVPLSSDPLEVAQLRAALHAARGERDEARRELNELKDRLEAAQTPAQPPPQTSLTSASTTMADPAPPHLNAAPLRPVVAAPPAATPGPSLRNPKLPGSDAHQFAGFWFFAKGSQANRNKSLYYPEFIEATLTEQNGVVHGKYRSRYQIVDRAISPDVNFEFSGSPSSGAITCSWTGQGGAKGQLTLHMTGENDMKVDWTASEIGSILGLASGTATLTRRVE